MHINRNNVSKSWPIPRKSGTKYLAVSTHNVRESIPLIVIMRDILKLVRTAKEMKKIINERQVKINGKEIRTIKYPVGLLDVISLNSGKNYKSVIGKNKKYLFEEVTGKESETKYIKITGKKILSKNETQLNLIDGRNIISKEDAKTGDSLLFNFNSNKIEKIIKMEKGKKGLIFKGKHASKFGNIEKIVERGGKLLAEIKADDEKINVWIKNIIVMD
jgi:small subunit ribosomal protein S4e